MKKNKTTMSLLSKLINEKGYKKLCEGDTGSDIYICMNDTTGNFDLLIANEGSKYFKEFELNDNILLKLFSVIYKDFKYEEDKSVADKSSFAKYLEESQNYETLKVNVRNIKDKIIIKKESFLKVDKTDFVFSIMTVLFVNDALTDVNVINLSFETTSKITDFIIKLAKEKKQEFEENLINNEGDVKNV